MLVKFYDGMPRDPHRCTFVKHFGSLSLGCRRRTTCNHPAVRTVAVPERSFVAGQRRGTHITMRRFFVALLAAVSSSASALPVAAPITPIRSRTRSQLSDRRVRRGGGRPTASPPHSSASTHPGNGRLLYVVDQVGTVTAVPTDLGATGRKPNDPLTFLDIGVERPRPAGPSRSLRTRQLRRTGPSRPGLPSRLPATTGKVYTYSSEPLGPTPDFTTLADDEPRAGNASLSVIREWRVDRARQRSRLTSSTPPARGSCSGSSSPSSTTTVATSPSARTATALHRPRRWRRGRRPGPGARRGRQRSGPIRRQRARQDPPHRPRRHRQCQRRSTASQPTIPFVGTDRGPTRSSPSASATPSACRSTAGPAMLYRRRRRPKRHRGGRPGGGRRQLRLAGQGGHVPLRRRRRWARLHHRRLTWERQPA